MTSQTQSEGNGKDEGAQVLNLEEASRYLRIKRRTLYSLAARGLVPGAKIGGQWRFRRSQLDGLFEGGCRGLLPPPGDGPAR